MQNTAEVEILEIDKMALLTELAIGRKGPDISIKKV